MLSHFFQAPARIREIRRNPFAALIEGFADYVFPASDKLIASLARRSFMRREKHPG